MDADLNISKEQLLYWKEKEILIQRSNKKIILKSFKVFWDSNPNEDEFSKHTSGLVLFPEVMFYMVKHNPHDIFNFKMEE